MNDVVFVNEVGSMVPHVVSVRLFKEPEEACLVDVFTTSVSYPALVVRHTKGDSSWYVVYVGVPRNHPWYGMEDYQEIVDVCPAAGLSFVGREPKYDKVRDGLGGYKVNRWYWYFGREASNKEDVREVGERLASVLYRVYRERKEAMEKYYRRWLSVYRICRVFWRFVTFVV